MTIFPSCFRRQLWYPPRASNLKVEQKFSSKFHFLFLWFCVWELLELKDLVRPPIPWTWSETLRKFICFKILSEFLFPRFSLTIITHPQLRPKSGHAQVRLVVQHRHLKHSRVCFLLYTANFYSVNFNTMKMKIDAESDFSHSLIVIMFPMDCYLEEHNTRCESQKTILLFILLIVFIVILFFIATLKSTIQEVKARRQIMHTTRAISSWQASWWWS